MNKKYSSRRDNLKVTNDDILDIIYEAEKPVYEDDYRVVTKIICDIQTHSLKWVKRVQLVKWKHKKGNKLEIDIRKFDTELNKYAKGISFTQREFSEFKKYINSIDFSENEI